MKVKSILINTLMVVISVSLTFTLASWWLQRKNMQVGERSTAERLVANHPSYRNYTSEEIDFTLPHYSVAQGQECIKEIRTPGMHYTAYFGWNTHKLDLQCAKRHFSQAGKKVLFFGGSAMENFEAPNYLTKIDTYVGNKVPGMLSLNLAESGGRSTNNLVRIAVEAMDLSADYWVFLDGYNEFNSIKYGGDFRDDYYWTATVRDRIHTPIKFMLDKFISKSSLLQKVFYGTGLVKSPRVLGHPVSENDVLAAADYYVQNHKKIRMLCEAKQVQCLFFLQPYVRSESEDMNSTRILDLGYARILEQLGDQVIDLRPFLANQPDAFVDEMHYNKNGGKIVGEAIGAYIERENQVNHT